MYYRPPVHERMVHWPIWKSTNSLGALFVIDLREIQHRYALPRDVAVISYKISSLVFLFFLFEGFFFFKLHRLLYVWEVILAVEQSGALALYPL